jgi:hypothetical protein
LIEPTQNNPSADGSSTPPRLSKATSTSETSSRPATCTLRFWESFGSKDAVQNKIKQDGQDRQDKSKSQKDRIEISNPKSKIFFILSILSIPVNFFLGFARDSNRAKS